MSGLGGGSLSMPTLVQRVTLDPSGVEAGTAKLEGMGNRIGNFFKKLATPQGLATIGVAIGAGLVDLGDKFAEMSHQIQKETGASGLALAGLGVSAEKAFANVPTSLGNAASAVDELYKRGVPLGPQLTGLAQQELYLAKITGTDLATSVDTTTSLFKKYNVPLAAQPALLDDLFKASQQSGKGIDVLSGTMLKGGSVLQQFGYNFQQSAAFIAALEKAGVNVQPAIGALRLAFGQIVKKGGNPVDVLKETFASLQSGKNPTEAMAAAMKLFGNRAGAELALAIKSGRVNVVDMLKTITDGKGGIDATGLATLSLGDKFALMRNRIELALAPVATKVFDAFDKEVDYIVATAGPTVTAVLRGIGDGVSYIKDHIGPFLPIVKALGAEFLVFKTAQLGIAVATKAWALAQSALNLAMDANPIILAITAIVAIGAAIYAAYQHWAPFRDAVNAVGSALAGFAQAVWSGIQSALSFIEAFPGNALRFLQRLPGNLVSIGASAMKGLGHAITAGIVDLGILFIDIPIKLYIWLAKFELNLIEIGAKALAGLLVGLVRALPSIASWFIALPVKILEFVVGADLWLAGVGVRIIAGLLKGLIAAAPIVWNWLKALPANILHFIINVDTMLYDIGRRIIGGLLNGLKDAFKGVTSWLGGVAGEIIKHKGPPSYDATILVPTGKLIMKGLGTGLQQGLPPVLSQLSTVTATVAKTSLTAAQAALAAVSPSTTTGTTSTAAQTFTPNITAGAGPTPSSVASSFLSNLQGARANATSTAAKSASLGNLVARQTQTLSAAVQAFSNDQGLVAAAAAKAATAAVLAVAHPKNVADQLASAAAKAALGATQSNASKDLRSVASDQKTLTKEQDKYTASMKNTAAAAKSLKALSNPALFTQGIQAGTAEVAHFQTSLQKLMQQGLSPLASELASQGPDAAGALAAMFAGNAGKAIAANKSIIAQQAVDQGFQDLLNKWFGGTTSGGDTSGTTTPVDTSVADSLQAGINKFLALSNAQTTGASGSDGSGAGGATINTFNWTVNGPNVLTAADLIRAQQRQDALLRLKGGQS